MDKVKTDFKKFKWCFGIVFANPLEFKEAVTRYAIAQGKNVVIFDAFNIYIVPSLSLH